MTNASTTTLVLGGTGRTGARVASRLTELGHSVRTAARHGADAVFDWDDPATHRIAVEGADRIYLVAPVMRTRFAARVPTGDGGEAFVDAGDIAAVAAVTLADPSAHAGPQYAPTGPDRLTMREAADTIGSVIGQPVRHVDVDRRA